MKLYQAELHLAKAVVREVFAELAQAKPESASFEYADTLPREMKAAIDRALEDIILKRLMPTGIGVLSEEAGALGEYSAGGLRWVVDPLDGTVNFIRGLAPCAVSIALCHGDDPVLGVIGEFPSGNVAWGGGTLGAFLDQKPLRVSTLADKAKAVLCTGFPARFDFSGPGMAKFSSRAGSFGKVRMLGAASLSLLQVAKGAAEAYAEQDIMLWDVAAGLALVQGAGGCVSMQTGNFAHSLDVFASNGHIND